MFSRWLKSTAQIDQCHAEQLNLTFEEFLSLARMASTEKGCMLLLSGSDLDSARYSILALHPWMTVTSRGHNIHIRAEGQDIILQKNPFAVLRSLLQHFRMDPASITLRTAKQQPSASTAYHSHAKKNRKILSTPVSGGLFGYLSYDLKDNLEDLPRTCIDDLGLPDLYLCAPGLLLIFDHRQGSALLLIPVRTDSLEQELKYWSDLQKRRTPPSHAPSPLKSTPGQKEENLQQNGLTSNFTREHYLRAVRKIKDYIVSGHVYQVNLSQRFKLSYAGDSFQTFLDLFEQNPAPFFAFLNCGDHQIISTSPERFLQVKNSLVETRPIKGTRPRGRTEEQDRQLARELMNSAKDQAELSMIVDLLRNDLGKVCQAGSVQVIEHKRLEKYANVFHLVSLIQGQLDQDKDLVDLIQACFPGGSITGCPKIRSMEIIDELEPHSRHIYTGSIGYLGFDGNMDLSIAIRTATIHQGQIYFSVGGGIVHDSNPEAEYEETLHKGQTLTRVLSPQGRPQQQDNIVWYNGQYMEAGETRISCMGSAIQYGFGCFETIRANHGQPMFLAEHIQRLDRSLQALGKICLPDLSWAQIIKGVLEANRLQKGIAAIKIMALLNQPEKQPDLLVLSRPYLPVNKSGLRLKTYPWPRTSPLAAHKTLNHLYYILAGHWAAEHNADQAMILNPDGTISETSCANILLIRQKESIVLKPKSSFVLPGVTQSKVVDYLKGTGLQIVKKKIYSQELQNNDLLLVCNSLLGVKGVSSVDNRQLGLNRDLEQAINCRLGFTQGKD